MNIYKNGKMLSIFFAFMLPVFSIHTYAFDDIQGHIYEQDILELNKLDILKGYPDGTFKPNKSVTRAEMMKIILKPILIDLDVDTTELTNCFPDIKDERYAQYICYGKQVGIIKGYPDGTYKPHQSVTYAEAMKITVSTYNPTIQEAKGEYRFEPFIDYLDDKKVFSKFDIYPLRNISRADVSHMVYEIILGEKIDDNLGSTTQTYIEKRNRTRQEPTTYIPQSLQELEIPTAQEILDTTSNIQGQSLGCNTQQPESAIDDFLVDGKIRNTITVVGEKYDHNTPSKLILAFHGRTNSNVQVRKYYGIEKAWDETGIIVYPSGLPENSSPRTYSNSGDPSSDLRDFALFDEIVAQISQNYCIDPDQIYVMGHSLGGRFANTLACARGDVIRATGSVGGSITASECTGTTASLIMHHPEDRLASFSSGEYARDILLENSMCTQQTQSIGPARGNCEIYTCADQEAPITRCPHSDSTAWNGTYYPHTRPDGAGELIWDFFTEHE